MTAQFSLFVSDKRLMIYGPFCRQDLMIRRQLLVQHSEKRSDVRAAFNSPVLVEDVDAGYIYRARMVNCSRNGIFIETDVGLDPGEEIYIGIENSPYQLSSDDTKSYRAKVIWRKGLDNGIFNFGYGVTIISGKDKKNPRVGEFQGWQDLRKHPRISYPKAVFFTSQDQYYQGFIYNISRGGVFIETKDIFTVGQIIKLVIPGTKIDNGVMLKAKIVHCSETGVGVTFKGKINNEDELRC